MRLSTRLTLAMVALVFVSAAAIGIIGVLNVRSVTLPRALNRLQLHAQLLALDLESSRLGVRFFVLGIRSSDAVAGIMRAREAGGIDPKDHLTEAEWRAKLAHRFETDMAPRPNYLMVSLIGTDDGGREIVRVVRRGPQDTPHAVPDAELGRRGDRGYFQSAVGLPPGEVYVSPVDLLERDGRILSPQIPFLRVATPIFTPDGRPFGIVIIRIDMRDAFAHVRSPHLEGSTLYVVNETGDYMIHPDADKEFAFKYRKASRIQDDFPTLAPLLTTQDGAAGVIEDRSGVRYGAGIRTFRIGGGPPVTLMETVPYRELMMAVTATRGPILIGVTIALVCAVLLAVALSRTLTGPLVQMTAAVEAFSRDEKMAVPVNASSEIGVLARAFARMANEVGEKTAALRRAAFEHRQTETALERHAQRERLFSAAVESSDDAIVTTTLEDIITGWNPGASRLFGYAAEEVLGQPVDILVPEDLHGELQDIRARIIRGERVSDHETVRVSKAGRRIEVSLSVGPVMSATGEVIGAAKIARDITARNRTRQELLESEQMARGVIDTALDAFIQLDEAGTVTDWNAEAQTLYGWSREEAIGCSLGELIIPAARRDSHADNLKGLLETAQSSPLRKRFRNDVVRRDGKQMKVEVAMTALRRSSGLLFNAFVRDITDQRIAEERARQAQKMEAVGQLTGGIAHDFNNMLTVITGTIDILGDGVADRPHLAAIAKLIGEAAGRGAELTARLLAFARQQPLRPRETDVNDLMGEAARLLRPTLGGQIEIQTVSEKSAWPALVDRTQLITAIVNLGVNARDAMPDGGKLRLMTRNVTLDAGTGEDVQPGPYVMIEVTDTGTGMSAEVCARAFEPFFSTKEVGKGTGLGLSMVYGFVKQSGGHIKIDSQEGRGTSVRLYLPRADELPEQAFTEAPGGAIEGGRETILIVEDDRMVRDYVAGQMSSLGYTTLTARNAAEALRQVDKGVYFDLLFTDIVMPGSRNGRQLSDEVARRRPGVRVLFTSGYTENAVTRNGQLEPGVLLLAKPYRRSDLARMIRTALDGATSVSIQDAARRGTG